MLRLNEDARRRMGVLLIRALLLAAPAGAALAGGCGLLVDLEDRTVELLPGQGITVPRGVVHRTRAPERTAMLMFEGAGVKPVGD